jgi:hypothetical protein
MKEDESGDMIELSRYRSLTIIASQDYHICLIDYYHVVVTGLNSYSASLPRSVSDGW